MNLLPIALILFLAAPASSKVRVGDITQFLGVQENRLDGIGIVVGLNGTGDQSQEAKRYIANLLADGQIDADSRSIQTKNAAVVAVTAVLPPDAKPGDKIDVTVSSLFDSSSLSGGTLLKTKLVGPNPDDDTVYALCQGPVQVGGFVVAGQAATVQKNHPTAGRIPGGAIVEEGVSSKPMLDTESVVMVLRSNSFLSAQRLAVTVNERFPGSATAIDGRSVKVKVPAMYAASSFPVEFMAELTGLEIEPDLPARVVIDGRTGTIVAGGNVRIGKVAISRGNLTVTISEKPAVSQPEPFSPGGKTQVVPRTQVNAEEPASKMVELEDGISIAKVSESLNALGLTPRDLIDIFDAINAAGALHAELVKL